MPRRSYKKSPVELDPVFKDLEITKLINYIMVDGKKSIARGIVYDVIKKLNDEGKDGMKVLREAIQNVSPAHEVKPRRLGGASYLVPTEVRQERKIYLGLNWIVDAARARSNKEYHSFVDKLYAELLDASQNQGSAVAKKQQAEKVAEANKAFSHLKW